MDQKKQLEAFLNRKQHTDHNSGKPVEQIFSNTITKIINTMDKVTVNKLTEFTIQLVKCNKEKINSLSSLLINVISVVCYNTDKFTLFTPTKCGSRSFRKYFSTLNINSLPGEDHFFLTEKDIIIVLRNPESRFYSGLLTSYNIVSSPEIFEEERRTISELVVYHTLGYHSIAMFVKQHMEQRGKLENLYHIPFESVNSYTNEIHDDKSDIDTIAHLGYLKTIIQPHDLYEKEIWHNEVSAYKYLLANSKEYSLEKWKRFIIQYYD